MTPSDRATIQTLATTQDLTLSSYLRSMAINGRVIPRDEVVASRIELRRVGNNLNQLVRALHQGDRSVVVELPDVLKELQRALNALRL